MVVATSNGTGSKPAQQAAGAGPSPPAGPTTTDARKRHVRKARQKPAVQLPAADTEAIDKVLAYTPFITAGLPRHRVVALTFDDGPSPYTAEIVNVLARMHVPATFFVVGQELNYFSSGLRDELRHGFVIGDHTENHPLMTQLSAAQQYKQIHDDAERIVGLGAPFPRLYRPPYGDYNSSTLAVVKQLKMLMTLWAVDTRDWERPGTAAILRTALSEVRPGAVILMHDGGGDRSETVAALPALINALRRRHYSFATVPQLLRLDPPPRSQRLPHVAE